MLKSGRLIHSGLPFLSGGAGITPQFVLKPTVWVTGSFVGRGFDITVVSQRDTWQSWKTTAIIVAMILRYVLPELSDYFSPKCYTRETI